jgi:hypothetical protein
MLGKKHSAETRARMSASQKARVHPKGYKLGPDAKARMSAARKAYWARVKAALRDAECIARSTNTRPSGGLVTSKFGS